MYMVVDTMTAFPEPQISRPDLELTKAMPCSCTEKYRANQSFLKAPFREE